MRRWKPEQLQGLIDHLGKSGFRVIGPKVKDEAITYDDLEQLPVGWGDQQERGHYRLVPRNDQSRFGYNLGPATWKQFLFPPSEILFSYRDGEFHNERRSPQKMAFVGVRACELAAIRVLDRVFAGETPEPGYLRRREELVLIAVNCSQAAATCFCGSTGDGPRVGEGADLVLTEVNPQHPWYLVQADTANGEALLQELGGETATAADRDQATVAVSQARNQLTRSVEKQDLGERLLEKLDHSHWEDVAERCLACGNCTQVCPTCFCSTRQEQTNPVSGEVLHANLWDSCFTTGHSYVAGGVVHQSVKSRYRQWLTHKLGSWEQQFGTSGCTGCGRCIAWCPVGIDLTEELKQLE